ncbi:MAG: hypothetical protein ACT4NY_28075 [Pseudonocardiales bacterium]
MTTQDYFIKDLADSVTGAIPSTPAPTATKDHDDPFTTQAVGEEGENPITTQALGEEAGQRHVRSASPVVTLSGH